MLGGEIVKGEQRGRRRSRAVRRRAALFGRLALFDERLEYIIKIDLALNVSLHTFLQILSVHSFEKVPLALALFDGQPASPLSAPSNQMNLFAN